MPRQSTVKLKGQEQTFKQQFFDPTVPRRRVSARPTDPYAAPAKSDNLRRFAESMRGITGGLTQAMNTEADKRELEGATAAMREEDLPENSVQAFIDGYEKYTSSTTDVLEYEEAVTALYNQSGGMAPDEFNTALSTLSAKHLAGRSDVSIRAFVPHAAKIEAKFQAKYNRDQETHIHNKLIAGVIDGANRTITDVYMDPDAGIADKGKAVRAAVTSHQKLLKPLGVHPSKVTAAFVEATGRLAVRTGRVEFLSWAFESDNGYVAANQPEFHAEIDRYVASALSEAEARDKAAMKAMNAARAEQQAALHRDIIDAYYADDLDGMSEKLLEAKESMKPTDYWKAKKHVDDLRIWTSEDFADVSDRELYEVLRLKAVENTLDLDELRDHHGELSKGDYMKVFEEMVESREDAISRSRTSSAKQTATEKLAKEHASIGKSMCAPRNAMGALLDPTAAGRRQGVFTYKYWELIRGLRKQYDGWNQVPQEKLLWAQNKAAYLAYTQVPPKMATHMPPDPDVKTPGAAQTKIAKSGDASIDADPFWTE